MREYDLYTPDEIREYMTPFLKFCQKHLDLENMPRVKLVKKLNQDSHQPTFATYDTGNHIVTVAYQNRHIMDVMRSTAHELVHHGQNLRNELTAKSGETGSEHENQANSMAGEIMRIWAKNNSQVMK